MVVQFLFQFLQHTNIYLGNGSFIKKQFFVIYRVAHNFGLINMGLSLFGVTELPKWLISSKFAMPAVIAVSVWQGLGYSMVLFVAGLQDIPRSLHEAAALDGASHWQRFWHVTWPMLRPTTAFVATTSLIISFQVFDVVRVMTQGGPVRSTSVTSAPSCAPARAAS